MKRSDILASILFYDIEDCAPYTINEDGTLTTTHAVDLSGKFIDNIPLAFDLVGGNFDCSFNDLNSLHNCPKVIYGNFDCSHNSLEKLSGFPDIILGNIYLSHNSIEQTDDTFNILIRFRLDQIVSFDTTVMEWFRIRRRTFAIDELLK